jgi:amylosucrase
MSSLAGLEEAIVEGDRELLDMALRRMRMVYGVLCAATGIPLIFLGEEWGLLNDYSYADDPDKSDDSRWVHRVRMNWTLTGELKKRKSVPKQVFRTLQTLFASRKKIPAFRGNRMRLIFVRNPHVLGFVRWHDASFATILANFSETEQEIEMTELRAMGLGHFLKDTLSKREYSTRKAITLEPYDILWLEEA